MADRLLSRINIQRRAFSWRPARSSTVMGLASPRRVRSAAMAGGRDLSPLAAWTSVGKATLTPAAREPVCRKRRRETMKRETMKPPGKEDQLYKVAGGEPGVPARRRCCYGSTGVWARRPFLHCHDYTAKASRMLSW